MKIKTISNFLDNKDFEEISKIKLNQVGSKEVKVYHNSISGEKIIRNDCIDEDFLRRLNRNYHNKALNILFLASIDLEINSSKHSESSTNSATLSIHLS